MTQSQLPDLRLSFTGRGHLSPFSVSSCLSVAEPHADKVPITGVARLLTSDTGMRGLGLCHLGAHQLRSVTLRDTTVCGA